MELDSRKKLPEDDIRAFEGREEKEAQSIFLALTAQGGRGEIA